MTQKAASGKMMKSYAKEMGSVLKKIVALVFEIGSGSIHTVVSLMGQDTTVQLRIFVLESEIWCLRTVVFLSVFRLVDVVANEEQP